MRRHFTPSFRIAFNVPCNFDALSLPIRDNYSRIVTRNELQDGNKWEIRLVVRRDSP